ncbi:MAG: VWA domain-containing protein [Deltaproteobacteria bacterium]|nr:VWA domain-containing protein [Deltaproteobacteria bacterium]
MRTSEHFERPAILLAAVLAAAIAVCGCGAAGGNVSFGGAQDMGQFKQILAEGEIPSTLTLDANGFFSEHYIQLPEPDCGQVLCAHASLAIDDYFVGDEKVTLVGVSINSPLGPEDIDPAPVDLAVVVDTSGSMVAEDKIIYAREGLHTLVDEMSAGDRLAIISYDTTVRTVLELSEITVDNVQAVHSLIGEIEASGATNIYEGLERGFLTVLEAAEPGRTARVILLSDGQASVGVTAAAAIQEMAYRFILDGVGLTTVGVGTDADAFLLEGLATLGNGNYYFLESVQAIGEVFVQELLYFLSTVAFDVRLELRFNPAYQILRAYGWDYELDYYLNTVRVTIPSVSIASRSGDEHEARRGGGSSFFVELRPDVDVADLGDFGIHEVADVYLDYRPADSDSDESQTTDIDNPNEPGQIDPDGSHYSAPWAEKGYAVFNLFEGLFRVCSAATRNYHQALFLLEQLQASAEAWNESRDDEDVRADLILLAQFAHNLEAKGADASKYDPDPYGTCASAGRGGAGLAVLALLGLLLARCRRVPF